MNWQIRQQGDATVVALGSELGIRDAAGFHQAVLAIVGLGGAVRVNAREAGTVHSSIMQILYALSQAVPNFTVEEASDGFQATEVRVGFSLPRKGATKMPADSAGSE